jgi:hypothetical protein
MAKFNRFTWLVAGLLFLAPVVHAEDIKEVSGPPEATPPVRVEAPGVPDDVAPDGGLPDRGLQQRHDEEDKIDDSAPKATREEVEAVHAEVEVLRDQWQRSLTRAYPTTVVQSNRPLIISGIGQLRYDETFNQPKNTAPSSFSIPFFNLTFSGNLRKDYLEGKNVDYSLGIQTTGTAAISITDAWLSYQILNSLDSTGPRLSITAGQQKKNFGNEATATEAFLPAIRVAQFASNLGLANRDLGLVLAGDVLPAVDFSHNYRVPLVQYWAAIVNGNGPNTVDNNNKKDFFQRIQFNAPVHYDHPLRGLSLGFSAYEGKSTVAATDTTTNNYTVNTVTGPTPTAPLTTTSSVSSTSTGTSNRYGADLAYVNTPVGFTLEYVHGKDPVATNGSVVNGARKTALGFKEVNEEAYTFTLFYNFGEQFLNSSKQQDRYDDYYPLTYQPFARFDRWIPDTSARGFRTDISTLGFNWFFAQTTKLQINYNYKDQKAVTGRLHSNELLAQFQFGF